MDQKSSSHAPGDNEHTIMTSSDIDGSKQTYIKFDEQELAKINNPNATSEELINHARELLNSYRKKKVRFPNGSSKLPQTCFFCTKVFANRKRLREHQFKVHLKKFGEFSCDICHERFLIERLLKEHMVSHSDDRNYVCKLCGLSFKRNSHRYKHMAMHKETNSTCIVCDKNFKLRAEFKEHCMQEHKSQVIECKFCKQTLTTPNSVYSHSLRHSGTREHVCQICGASFKLKQHLIGHKRIHEDSQDNIKCPACQKEFPYRMHFRKHLEQFHKDLAPTYRYDHICIICGKDFAYKGRLDEHMKLHVEEMEEERFPPAKKGKVYKMSDETLSETRGKTGCLVNSGNPELGIADPGNPQVYIIS